ncbi:hypothetical protein ACF3NR_06795 [Vaginella massiliensis]|uniref:hypothetical protein n=1 Tax=Vaginella massiliensis TaxID=1816680 RepID=UPI003753E1A4
MKNKPRQLIVHNLEEWQELIEGYHPTHDKSRGLKIYKHFSATKDDLSLQHKKIY